jgi:hypothetical protein
MSSEQVTAFLEDYVGGKKHTYSGVKSQKSKETSTASTFKANKEPVKKIEKEEVHEYQKEIVIRDKYKKIRAHSEELLDLLKKFPCSNNDLKELQLTDEYDMQSGCKGPAVYVCHHCKTSLCSTHSYWIPDEKFPYFSKPGAKLKVVDNTAVMRQEGENLISGAGALFFLAILCAFTPLTALFSIIFFVSAGTKYIEGWIKVESSKFKPTITNPHPEFKVKYETKWGNTIEKRHAFMGYYTAVHCWNCLLKYHHEFINVAKAIFNIVFNDAVKWYKYTESGVEPYTESDGIKAGNFAANLYLNDFKFANICLFPKDAKIEKLERPLGYNTQINVNQVHSVRYYPPTPVWVYPASIVKEAQIDEEQVFGVVKKLATEKVTQFFVITAICAFIGFGIALGMGISFLGQIYGPIIVLLFVGIACLIVKAKASSLEPKRLPKEIDETNLYRWVDKYRHFIKAKLKSR